MTPSNPPPPTNNFCLYPPPVLRCFWKDPLMTPPPPNIKHPSLLPPSPSTTPPHPPPLPPPKNFDHTLSTFESGERIHPVNNSLSLDTSEQPVRVVWRRMSVNVRPIGIKFVRVGIVSGYMRTRQEVYPDTCECYSYPMKLSSDRMG